VGSPDFFYIYADILLFYRQGHVAGLLAGKAGSIEITPAFVLVSALVMAIPSLMVFLSLALKATSIAGQTSASVYLRCCVGGHPLRGEDHR